MRRITHADLVRGSKTGPLTIGVEDRIGSDFLVHFGNGKNYSLIAESGDVKTTLELMLQAGGTHHVTALGGGEQATLELQTASFTALEQRLLDALLSAHNILDAFEERVGSPCDDDTRRLGVTIFLEESRSKR